MDTRAAAWLLGSDGLHRAWQLGQVEMGRAYGLGPDRKGIGFFLIYEFIFNAKTIPGNTRNCLKARKILRKSQKFQENS
jgi:hypothetical protein